MIAPLRDHLQSPALLDQVDENWVPGEWESLEQNRGICTSLVYSTMGLGPI